MKNLSTRLEDILYSDDDVCILHPNVKKGLNCWLINYYFSIINIISLNKYLIFI